MKKLTPARIGLIALAFAVAILIAVTTAVGVGYALVPRDRLEVMEPGGFGVDGDAVGEYPLGEHVLLLEPDGVRVDGPGGTVWGSSPGTAFLAAARGDVEWQEERGYFWSDVTHGDTWADQQVTGVDVEAGRVELAGRLSGAEDASDTPFTVAFSERPGGGVVADVDVADAGAQSDIDSSDRPDVVHWTGARSPGAGVHGFGEQFDDFDLTGRLIPVVIREQGVGRGEQPLTFLADLTNTGAGGTRAMTYATWPTYVTGDMQGIRLDPEDEASYSFAVGDTRDAERVGLEVWSPEMRIEMTRADTPAELVRTQQNSGSADGERPMLAEWTQDGAIVGIQGGTDEVRRVVDELENAGTDIAGVWLQDWTGRRTTEFGDRLWWTWQLDEARYPGWEELLTDLRERGIRTTTYVNPWLVDAAPKGDPDIRNLWAEADEGGLLVGHPDGGPYMVDQGQFDAALVDLTNPDGREWMAGVVAEEVLAHGVDGFMADFGEALPMDAVLHSGADAEQMHNAWPRLWAETVRAGCEQAGRPDCVSWFRAGTFGMDTQTPAFWNGDQMVTWSADDGLASALLGTFSAGVSGWPVVHSDIGGYTSIDAVVRDYVRDEELLARWGEYAAFGPLFRSHEGNRPDANRQVYDAGEIEAFARNSRVFSALAPYREGVLEEAAATGLPVMRHAWLHHPGSAAAARDDQFLLGESLLVAPVMEPDTRDAEVTLPPGRWQHLVTGEVYEGDQTMTVPAPIGSPAAFVEAEHPMAADLVTDVGAALEG